MNLVSTPESLHPQLHASQTRPSPGVSKVVSADCGNLGIEVFIGNVGGHMGDPLGEESLGDDDAIRIVILGNPQSLVNSPQLRKYQRPLTNSLTRNQIENLMIIPTGNWLRDCHKAI